jgi:hypothetical protein
MVIRSVAGSRVAAGRVDSDDTAVFDCSSARLATRASADSERPRAVASSAKHCFSVGVGRAVIDGSRELDAGNETAKASARKGGGLRLGHVRSGETR